VIKNHEFTRRLTHAGAICLRLVKGESPLKIVSAVRCEQKEHGSQLCEASAQCDWLACDQFARIRLVRLRRSTGRHLIQNDERISMKTVIALIISAAAVVGGAILHYITTSGTGSRGLANTGTELIVAGVLGLASSNVAYLMNKNHRRPARRAEASETEHIAVAPRTAPSEHQRRSPVHSSGR
jgi:hypothetical protein